MPLLAVAHLLIVLYFGVHVVRTGRPSWWLFLLISAPGLGAAIYFFAEYLPSMRHGRAARQAIRAVQQVSRLVDPQRELREAQADVDRTPSADHRVRLAEALLRLGRSSEAVTHYHAALQGPMAGDVALRFGLARAQWMAGRSSEAVATLDALFAAAPEQREREATLLHAQALADVDRVRADEAYRHALAHHDTIETRAAYGLFLLREGRPEAARRQLDDAMKMAQGMPAHARELNRDAIDRLRAAVDELDRPRTGTAG